MKSVHRLHLHTLGVCHFLSISRFSPRTSSGFACRIFGLLSFQSTFWLLSCTCSVAVKYFIALFKRFSSFPLGFCLASFGLRSHSSQKSLCFLFGLKDCLVFWGLYCVLFYSMLLSLKICLVHFAIEKKRIISFALHQLIEIRSFALIK